MNEVTAVEKLDGMIAESQSEAEPNLYPFDLTHVEVGFNARPNTETPKIVYHKLRKPTLQELKERESQVKAELVSVSNREEEEHTDEISANANLWRKLIVAVKGYREASDWRELSDAEKADMKVGHKSRAIRKMYLGTSLLESGDDDVSIGAEIWTVRQEIGPQGDPAFIVRHSLREPTEGEREKFRGSARRTSYVRIAKKTHTKIKTSLQAYCDLYDATIISIDGATVGNRPLGAENRKVFLAAIDPLWKRQIIETLMETLEGQLSD